MDFHPVAVDTAQQMLAVVKYILGLNISKAEKKARLEKAFNLVGADFYLQMFDASSEVFASEVIASMGYDEMLDRVGRLSTKILRNYALGRDVRALVESFYDSELGKAEAEAFQNAVSLGRHPTLTRSMVGETCGWCAEKAGVHVYPDGELFARHENCDCLLVVSGYNSRNGVVTNYKKGSSQSRTMQNIGVSAHYWRVEMEPNERKFAQKYPKEIRWINKTVTKNAKRLSTNDYVLVENGMEYELKTVNKATYKSIARRIKKAVQKAPDIKQRFMIDIGDKKLTDTLLKNLSEYNLRTEMHKIMELRVFSKGEETIIELKE